jgi:bifunctional enzyme CysN/CysC
MPSPSPSGADVDAQLAERDSMDLLRFITCGSVDDGKSTLIGRLLWDSGLLYVDHQATLEADSKRHGTQGSSLDFALLLDGLAAEREQKITIDVAYRHFSTARRRFIVADTPGHEEYTRNMATGASTADCAVILADARKGVLSQTLRHSYIVSALGFRHVVLAVNKMDLVDYSEERFEAIEREYREAARRIGLADVVSIPVSALHGDNVVQPSRHMSTYKGPTLVEYLESVEVDVERMQSAPFRLPVQWVIRPDSEFRGFAGTVAGGSIRAGDRVRILPSGRESEVVRIATFDGDLAVAVAGQAVTLTLADDIDVSRGAIIATPNSPPQVADQFEATMIWMADEPLLPGRSYLLRCGTMTAGATVAPLKYKVNVTSLEHVAATRLDLNEIGVCQLELDQPIAFDPYGENRDTGGFVVIDRITHHTVGAGMLRYALRRSHNLHRQAVDVDKVQRAASLDQKPYVVWLTGLSGAGKSTIANMVERKLHGLGRHTYLLDGDNVRHGLNKDLGFTSADRVENIRRVAEVAKLMVDAGLIVLVSFISPFRSERLMARELFEEGEFIEVFVDASLEVAEQRDPKGLYKKARQGQLKNFTGIDSPYETPEHPELHVSTDATTPEEAASLVLEALVARGLLSR